MNRARARMTLGSPRQRHPRATSQPAGAVARGAATNPTAQPLSLYRRIPSVRPKFCSQVHTSTNSLLTPGQWDQAAASIVMHRPRAPLINLPPFPLHAQITTAARTTEPHGRGIVSHRSRHRSLLIFLAPPYPARDEACQQPFAETRASASLKILDNPAILCLPDSG